MRKSRFTEAQIIGMIKEQEARLPTVPTPVVADQAGVCGILRKPKVTIGMAAMALLFMGQFAAVTYFRPLLEQVTGVNVATLSLIPLGCCGMGLVGNSATGSFAARSLRGTLLVMPISFALVAMGLIRWGHQPFATGVLLALGRQNRHGGGRGMVGVDGPHPAR